MLPLKAITWGLQEEMKNHPIPFPFPTTPEEGIFDYENKSYYERLGFRINSEHKIKKYLTVGENLTYTHQEQTGTWCYHKV